MSLLSRRSLNFRMPIYIYKHPSREEYVEVIQTMTEEHVYTDQEGLEWKRVFVNPQLNCSSNIDPFNNNAFIEKTGSMKGTYGDMLDYSKEMSEKRKSLNGGIDPVKDSYYKNYSAQRKGSKHPNEIKEKGYESKNVKIDFN